MCAKRFPMAGRMRRSGRWPIWWTGSAADRVSIELTHHGHPLDDERNAALAALAPRFGVGVVATTGAHFAASVAQPAGHGDGRDPGPAVPGFGRRVAGPAGRLASALR